MIGKQGRLSILSNDHRQIFHLDLPYSRDGLNGSDATRAIETAYAEKGSSCGTTENREGGI